MEEKKLTGYPSIDKPWLKYYSEEAINTPLPECTLYEHILKCNSDNLDRIALNYYGTNISYRSLFEEIDRIASALAGIGVKQGDIVTVIMINSPETVSLMFALNKVGAVANMVYGADTPEEIKKHIVDADSQIVFILDLFQDKVLEILNHTSVQKVIVANLMQSMSLFNRIGAALFKKLKPLPLPSDPRFMNWKSFINHCPGAFETAHDAAAPAFITYTGGTTGGSKGVLLSNFAVIAVAQQYIIGEEELYRKSRWMQVLPLFIAYGVTCSLMIPLSVGMTLIVRIPMSDTIAQLCKKFKPNHIMYSPAFWEAFADENENFDLSYLIAPISGGDILPEKAERKINSYLEKHGSPYCLMNGYGMTEVGAAVSVNYRHTYEFGSVGAPFVKNIVSAFDIETGKELPCGKEGEICIHTPSMMIGYLNNPEETSNIIRRHDDGLLWIHSGDLGYISENGFIHISGRLKRYMLCFSNGVAKKVFSLDIEKVLVKHPNVEKCAVVPINDEVINQAPVAFVVPLDNMEKKELEQSLIGFANEKLDQLYRPVRYYFLSKFPLTKVGKIDYRALEKQAEELNK
ncbi:MAG: acyl--CoA ligase [Clostridia bacterium]|nr:acyl--CoA ligase [Clostridia bacterium]